MHASKNILIVTPSKISLTETFIQSHIKGLEGDTFHLCGGKLDFKTSEDISLSTIYQPNDTYLHKLSSLLPHYLFFRLKKRSQQKYSAEALIKRYLKEHHIKVVVAEYGISGSYISPICKDLKIPLIVHFHGYDASKYDILDKFKEGYQHMFNYATYVVAVSQTMKNALIHLGCPRSKIVVNPCGPNDNYLENQPDYNSNEVVAVGRQTFKKAPYLTILAFQKVLKKYPYLKLTLIGTGVLFEVCKQMVQSLGLENNVNLPGALKPKDIKRHLEGAFLFVQHSLVAQDGDSEGTPVGILEAMAAGLPVVSTRHAGIMDVVEENESGFLVNEGDIDTMADCIIKLVENRQLAQQMGNRGRKRIHDFHSMKRHIDTLNNLISKVT